MKIDHSFLIEKKLDFVEKSQKSISYQMKRLILK